ncbi:uncharacterized protein LOC143919306 [Arctopsyche grandis]|uniref:uncharacterized protein LOC143919306 n=1 Tax=Arctopsyche grandis TaxID=121162 RepID=UPI00406D7D9E
MRVVFLIVVTLAVVLGGKLPLTLQRAIEIEKMARVSNRFTFNLPAQLRVGSKIEIEGKTSKDLKERISMNLVTTLNENGGLKLVPYHHRLDLSSTNQTVISSLINGHWADDYVREYYAPIQKGDIFKAEFEIIRNGTISYFYNRFPRIFYRHQSPFEDIKYIVTYYIEEIYSVKLYL